MTATSPAPTAETFEPSAIAWQLRPVPAAELWQRYRRDTSAGCAPEENLIQQYLPLVKAVVGRLAMALPAHVDADDLHSAGLVGLLNAVRHYDPTAGTSFETYARIRIRGAVFDELRKLDWVPRSIHSKARKIQHAMQAVEQRSGRLPTDLEMARELNLPMLEYHRWLAEVRPATFVCLDAAQSSEADDGATNYESVADTSVESPEDGAHRRELTELIAARIQQLPEMQRKVLALYYFEDMRLREIAEGFGVTESRICQIHSQAILAIKAHLKRKDASPA
ncbi:MAG: polymerase sigma factor FliA [Verrucomicrobiota bacterium]|jgi:RNA polymerase sigma factor for flagellar operon FliA